MSLNLTIDAVTKKFKLCIDCNHSNQMDIDTTNADIYIENNDSKHRRYSGLIKHPLLKKDETKYDNAQRSRRNSSSLMKPGTHDICFFENVRRSRRKSCSSIENKTESDNESLIIISPSLHHRKNKGNNNSETPLKEVMERCHDDKADCNSAFIENPVGGFENEIDISIKDNERYEPNSFMSRYFQEQNLNGSGILEEIGQNYCIQNNKQTHRRKSYNDSSKKVSKRFCEETEMSEKQQKQRSYRHRRKSASYSTTMLSESFQKHCQPDQIFEESNNQRINTRFYTHIYDEEIEESQGFGDHDFSSECLQEQQPKGKTVENGSRRKRKSEHSSTRFQNFEEKNKAIILNETQSYCNLKRNSKEEVDDVEIIRRRFSDLATTNDAFMNDDLNVNVNDRRRRKQNEGYDCEASYSNTEKRSPYEHIEENMKIKRKNRHSLSSVQERNHTLSNIIDGMQSEYSWKMSVQKIKRRSLLSLTNKNADSDDFTADMCLQNESHGRRENKDYESVEKIKSRCRASTDGIKIVNNDFYLVDGECYGNQERTDEYIFSDNHSFNSGWKTNMLEEGENYDEHNNYNADCQNKQYHRKSIILEEIRPKTTSNIKENQKDVDISYEIEDGNMSNVQQLQDNLMVSVSSQQYNKETTNESFDKLQSEYVNREVISVDDKMRRRRCSTSTTSENASVDDFTADVGHAYRRENKEYNDMKKTVNHCHTSTGEIVNNDYLINGEYYVNPKQTDEHTDSDKSCHRKSDKSEESPFPRRLSLRIYERNQVTNTIQEIDKNNFVEEENQWSHGKQPKRNGTVKDEKKKRRKSRHSSSSLHKGKNHRIAETFDEVESDYKYQKSVNKEDNDQKKIGRRSRNLRRCRNSSNINSDDNDNSWENEECYENVISPTKCRSDVIEINEGINVHSDADKTVNDSEILMYVDKNSEATLRDSTGVKPVQKLTKSTKKGDKKVPASIKKYYLDKKIPKSSNLETIFEIPENDIIMSRRKYRRAINFDSFNSAPRLRKRKQKAKKVNSLSSRTEKR